jgi:hypothetical protein
MRSYLDGPGDTGDGCWRLPILRGTPQRSIFLRQKGCSEQLAVRQLRVSNLSRCQCSVRRGAAPCRFSATDFDPRLVLVITSVTGVIVGEVCTAGRQIFR